MKQGCWITTALAALLAGCSGSGSTTGQASGPLEICVDTFCIDAAIPSLPDGGVPKLPPLPDGGHFALDGGFGGFGGFDGGFGGLKGPDGGFGGLNGLDGGFGGFGGPDGGFGGFGGLDGGFGGFGGLDGGFGGFGGLDAGAGGFGGLDAGAGGCNPTNPKYAEEYVQELESSSTVPCGSCSTTECCFAGLACVAQ